jgi:hypothetical protein
MQYKAGDKLRVKKGHEEKCASYFIEDGSYIVIKGLNDPSYSYNIYNEEDEQVDRCACFTDDDLEPYTTLKTFDNPQIGDEYKDRGGCSRWVTGVAGRNIFLSGLNKKDESYTFLLKEELIASGYTIVQDQPKEEVEELTLAEISERLGKTIKIKN